MKTYIFALLRRIIWFGMMLLHYAMRIFPLKKNKIFISNFCGKGYGDNAKYICEELFKKNKYDIVWLVNDLKMDMPKEIRKVKRNTIKQVYELCTAGIWIDNCRKPIYVRKRKKQYYIQTWHGDIGNKKIEKDVVDSLSPEYVKAAQNDSKMINIIISGNEWFTNLVKRAFWYEGEIGTYGSPRRDIFYCISKEKTDEIRRKISVSTTDKIVLYAPTFRNEQVKNYQEIYGIDWDNVLNSLEIRFGGKWIGMIRLHPNISDMSSVLNYSERVIDVTSYPDMQELLLASDACITDYSSSLFEFAVTKKPGFIFAVDYEEYINDREAHFDYSELPFSLAKNNQELISNIVNFDKTDYEDKCNSFYNEIIGMRDDGKASQTVVSLIEAL